MLNVFTLPWRFKYMCRLGNQKIQKCLFDIFLTRTKVVLSVYKCCIEQTSIEAQLIPFAQYRTRPGHMSWKKDRWTTKSGSCCTVKSEMAASIILAPRNDGLGLCQGCRSLIATPASDSISKEKMDKWFDSLGSTLIFFILEVNIGCWQVQSKDGDRNKKSTTLHHELYKPARISLGLCTVLCMFQQTIVVELSLVNFSLQSYILTLFLYFHEMQTTFSRSFLL